MQSETVLTEGHMRY